MIFLDFDGVLFNTVKEAYAVSMIATGKQKNISEINFESEHYKQFLKYRYLVAPAWNYKYILDILEDNNEDFERQYIDAVKKANINEYNEFEDKFFNTRDLLKNSDFSNWLALNEPYDFLNKIKRLILAKQDKFILVTTKDKATVQKLLLMEGIKFNDKSIYDKKDFEKYTNKADIIKMIIDDKKIRNAIFIDDNKKHLDDCRYINNLMLFEADWGYVSPNTSSSFSQEDILKEIIKGIV